jgi:tRNA dimethylallyltransferase
VFPEELLEAVILSGPTASGKTALAVRLAQRLDAEIISMDAFAVYRGMDIGTAKPTAAERRAVPHHLIDVLDPHESANVGWWLRSACAAAARIQQRGRRVLIVGGTPMYLKATLCGLFPGPPVDIQLRKELNELSDSELLARLAAVDPDAAERLHANDRKRLARALEIFLQTGKPLSRLQTEFASARPRRHPPVWLDWPRPLLHERIHQRVDAMFAAGLIDETRALLAHPLGLSTEARRAAGYAEVIRHLAGEMTLEQTCEAVKTHTRQLAKRQVTWLRHMPGAVKISVTPQMTVEDLAEHVLAAWRATGQ